MDNQILLIDDDADVQSTVSRVLMEHGYAVKVISSTQALRDFLPAPKPWLIFLDREMGPGNEMELILPLTHSFPAVPIVLLTDSSSADAAMQAVRSGAFDVLSKPIDPVRLITTTRRAVEQHAMAASMTAPPAEQKSPARGTFLSRFSVGQTVRIAGISGALMSLSLLGSNLAFRSASDRAIINAPAITLSNQFEGTVTGAPPAAGTGIHRGQVLCSIADDHLDASRLQQLIADSTVTEQQIAALTHEKQDLQNQRDQIRKRLAAYQKALLNQLAQRMEEANAVTASAAAKLARATEVMKRVQQCEAGGATSGNESGDAQAEFNVCKSDLTAAQTVEKRLADERNRVAEGVFISEDDGRNDVPYSQQFIDQIDLRIATLTTQLAECGCRREQLHRQIDLESGLVDGQALQKIVAPVDGVVYQRLAVAGTELPARSPLFQLINPGAIYVDALVGDSLFRSIRINEAVIIRLVGSNEVVSGRVVCKLGPSTAPDSRTDAATLPQRDEGEYRVQIALNRLPFAADPKNLYYVGCPVDVEFKGPILRWFGAE